MKFTNLKHRRIFEIFEEICSIPHGSGNCQKLTDYLVHFANRINLKHYTDNAGNVVIYKDGSAEYKNAEPVLLQGHIDMVCQKTYENTINFETDGLSLMYEGDYIYADGTTLGGDNGIAVAMILAILESDSIVHPPIEAVFTTDEEIGMIGAGKLNMSVLSAKRMINLDAEEDSSVIVSCAGGCDVSGSMQLELVKQSGAKLSVEIKGLLGGHSGVEINNGRFNSNILAGRILYSLSKDVNFDIISINGGNKGNAITNLTKIELLCDNPLILIEKINEISKVILAEIKCCEPGFIVEAKILSDYEQSYVFAKEIKDDIIFILNCIPNGVLEMSKEIENLVETSLNLGILETKDSKINLLTALRSNKQSSLYALADKLELFLKQTNFSCEVSGFYPSWEFKNESPLQKLYIDAYTSIVGAIPKIEAIHAGLECAVFASKINDIDCIAIGPNLFDVHTVNEKLSISSTIKIFDVLLEVLRNL